jgi:hypothetical protein
MLRHILAVSLALGVATMLRPAGGFVLREQRMATRGSDQPVEWHNPTEAIIDLSGTWQWRTAKEEIWHPGWIPSCFDNFQGEIIFKKEFSLPDSLRNWHFHLVVPEANYKVSVVVNGKFIESVAGSHLGFVLDLPSQLLRIRLPNTLELRVDNELSPKTTLPLSPQIFSPRNCGGILSDCHLWVTPPWAIESAVLRSSGADTIIGPSVVVDISRLIGTGTVSPPFSEIACSAEIQDEKEQIIAHAGPMTILAEGPQTQQVTLRFPPFRACRWAPDSPCLYRLDVLLETSQGLLHLYRRTVGFKDFTIRDKSFFLNGQPLEIRGVQYVPEDPGAGEAISQAIYEADVRRMKELGFNVLHVIPTPPSPVLLDVCDRLGMLVFSQLPLDGIPADLLARASYTAQCEYALKRLIRRDRMHVCVAAWGLGDDLDWADSRTLRVFDGLTNQLRNLDSRPVFLETYDMDKVGDYPADFFLQGLAPWRGDASSVPESCTRPVILSRVGMMVTEAGRGAGRGNTSSQADFLLTQFERASHDPEYSGMLIFCFSDFRGQLPLLAQDNKNDPFLYSFGLVDLARRERVAFFKLRDLAQTGETSPISQSPSSESPRVEFPVISLVLIVLLSLEIRRNNVFKQNLKRVFLHAHGFFSDIYARRFLQPTQTFVLVVTESLCWALVISSIFWGLRYSYRFDYVLTHFLRWPAAKLSCWDLVWNPIYGIIGLTLVILLLILAKALVVKIGALLFRARVTFGKAITYVAWAAANFVFLLPLAVVYYRLVDVPKAALPCALILVGFLLWFALRFVNAVRVAYNTSYLRLYLVVLSAGTLLVLAVVLFLQASIGTVSYMTYYWNVMAH